VADKTQSSQGQKYEQSRVEHDGILAKNSKPAYFTRKRDGRQALLKKLSIFGHLPDVSPPAAG
jgi:hypothetical protein